MYTNVQTRFIPAYQSLSAAASMNSWTWFKIWTSNSPLLLSHIMRPKTLLQGHGGVKSEKSQAKMHKSERKNHVRVWVRVLSLKKSCVRVRVCFRHGLGHELMSEVVSVHLWGKSWQCTCKSKTFQCWIYGLYKNDRLVLWPLSYSWQLTLNDRPLSSPSIINSGRSSEFGCMEHLRVQ